MPDRPAPLAGKAAIVVGGARRIGRAAARRLAADGASVMVATRAARAEAEAVAREIEAEGGRAAAHLADVTDPAAVEAMVGAAVARFGRLDILVHNAVSRRHGALETLSLEDWRAVMAVVLDGAFLCAKYAAPHLAPGGSLVFIGGGTAFTGAADPATPTAKSGLVGLMRSLALSLGPRGVRVFVVSPGRIDSPADDSAERLETLARSRPTEAIPLRRPGAPADVAATVAAAVGPDMGYVTGQVLHVAGGYIMS